MWSLIMVAAPRERQAGRDAPRGQGGWSRPAVLAIPERLDDPRRDGALPARGGARACRRRLARARVARLERAAARRVRRLVPSAGGGRRARGGALRLLRQPAARGADGRPAARAADARR